VKKPDGFVILIRQGFQKADPGEGVSGFVARKKNPEI
jgi:hypothetical protein